MNNQRQEITNLSRSELRDILEQRGEPGYRATQIAEWLYRKRAMTFEEMTNLPKALRQELSSRFTISRLRLVEEVISEEDGASKYCLELPDNNLIETVFLPHSRGATLCMSTQVGCGYRCVFCATGKMGLIRNLSPGEIVDQALFVATYLGNLERRPFSNVVFMGMGEPLANFDSVVKAISLLINEVGIGARRITISTCGIPERILDLAKLPYEIGLAISINATTDEVRSKIMPVAGKIPLVKIISAARQYHAMKRTPTFEYVLLKGINDTPEDAHRLASFTREVPAKINLIRLNPFPGCPYEPPDENTIVKFQSILRKRGKKVTLRKSLGCDILAGCGQLGSRLGQTLK